MSLINTNKNPASISGKSFRKKYNVTAAEIARLGAFTTGDIILDTLPAGCVVTVARIKHNTAVAGAAGPITAATAQLFIGNPGVTETALTAGSINVFTAPSTTDSTSVTGVTATKSPLTLDVQPNLFMRITETGATTGLSDVTAGSIDAMVNVLSISTL